MKSRFLITVLALGVMLSSFAQDEKKEREGKPSKKIQYATTAKAIASYGYETNDALCLLSAAQILIAHPTEALVPEKMESGSSETPKNKPSEVVTSMDVKKLIEDARQIAVGDEHILAMANDIEGKIPATTKGSVNGPYYKVENVYADDYDLYWVKFYGGELAEVAISGDGDTDLDLYIYDANGNLIESDTDYSDDCYTSWVPKWTGSFKIKVKNRGNVYNNYVLVTN